MREPAMKGIVQEFYHQHNKYRHYSMTIKMKEKRRWIGALLTAMFSWGPFTRDNRSRSQRSRVDLAPRDQAVGERKEDSVKESYHKTGIGCERNARKHFKPLFFVCAFLADSLGSASRIGRIARRKESRISLPKAFDQFWSTHVGCPPELMKARNAEPVPTTALVGVATPRFAFSSSISRKGSGGQRLA